MISESGMDEILKRSKIEPFVLKDDQGNPRAVVYTPGDGGPNHKINKSGVNMFFEGAKLKDKPKAFKKLTPDGIWEIYFSPNEKFSGVNYSKVWTGFMDEDDAEKLLQFCLKEFS